MHGALAHNLKLRVTWIEAEGLETRDSAGRPTTDYVAQLEESFDGILVPGGFGKRGIEGMLNAIRYARETLTPYFGICLGMADCLHRAVCPQRLRPQGRQLRRVRPCHALPHHLQTT